jgi:hypothetical protein
VKIMESKTKQAVRWINESPGRTQYAAAKIFDVAQSALSVALQAQAKCIHLWKLHGDMIELGQVSHLTTKDHRRAVRGREILRELEGRSFCRPERLRSKVGNALDYLAITPNASILNAAEYAGVSPSAVYAARKIEADRMRALDAIGEDVCDRIAKRAEAHPQESLANLATFFEVPLGKMRDAMTARDTLSRRSRMPRTITADYRAGMEQAAKIAEMVGGEHGAAVATAIRSVGV